VLHRVFEEHEVHCGIRLREGRRGEYRRIRQCTDTEDEERDRMTEDKIRSVLWSPYTELPTSLYSLSASSRTALSLVMEVTMSYTLSCAFSAKWQKIRGSAVSPE
jgi:hypothetical protein